MKLALGTAQFGFNYGISNTKGEVPRSEILQILNTAKNVGIDFLDTAAAYGNSEQQLGQIEESRTFRIITKLPSIGKNKYSLKLIEQGFLTSLQKLNRENIYCLLLHDANDLLSKCGNEVYNLLIKLKSENLVTKIGVSTYSPMQLNKIISKFKIDLVQLPINLFDQRFALDGMLEKLKMKGIEIHARSIFLQGLLLMQREKACMTFPLHKKFLAHYHDILHSSNKSPISAALSLIKEIPEIDKAVIGVTSKDELNEIICTYKSINTLPKNLLNLFKTAPQQLIDPREWRVHD
ncbi:MAG: aldo/keto reductase [Coxiellaceae bacterium]|nr:aldo/keto reductase [Coxiellaceae bacterium]